MSMAYLSIYLHDILFLSLMFFNFQYTDPVHILLDIYLISLSLWSYYVCYIFVFLYFFLKILCGQFTSFYLFIYLFLAVLGLRLCTRALSSCGKRGPLFIAVRGPLIIAASLVAEHRPQTCRLSNCGSRAQLLRGTRDPPRPGLEPASPAPAGRFSTTAPPGKPLFFCIFFNVCYIFKFQIPLFIAGT